MKNVSFELLSRNRTKLMGLSILSIMVYHVFIYTDVRVPLTSFLKIGVEFFLLLSAIGLNRSLSNSGNLKHYYYRRFIRILPLYFFIAVPFYFFLLSANGPFDPLRFFSYLFFVKTFEGIPYFWFITLILLCYLIAPFYYCFVRRIRYSIVVPFGLYIMLLLIPIESHGLQTFLYRFPIFLLGFEIAQFVERRNTISNRILYFVSIICGIWLLALWRLQWLSLPLILFVYFLCSPFLLLLLSSIGFNNKVNEMLEFLGSITLEIYLIHENLLVIPLVNHGITNVYVLLFTIPVSCLFAYFVHCFYSRIVGIDDRLKK